MRGSLALVFAAAIGAAGCVANVENVVVVDVHAARCEDDARALAEIDRGLEAYGTWSEDDTYGTIWTPSDGNFVPYATDGRFADMNGELIWVSDVPWGTTLHHGRWARCKERWCWVPGTKYAGAWVTWKHDGDRTSWAPTPPARIWRNGAMVPITAPDATIVGTRSDDELALVPPDPPPTRLETRAEKPAPASEDADFVYRDIARRTAAMGDDAADAFQNDDFFAFGSGGSGGGHAGHGGHGGGGGGHAHGSSSHSAHVSGGHVSSGGGGRAHAVGHR